MKEKMMKNQIKREECRNWFCSHIVVIAVVCFALGLFLSSCHFAKAEDYTSEFWESVQNDLNYYSSQSSYNDVYNTYISRCSNYGLDTDIVKYVRFPLNNGNGVLYLFAAYDHAIYCTVSAMNGDLNNYSYVLNSYNDTYSYTLISDDNGHRFFALYIISNYVVSFGNHRTQGTSSINVNYINSDYSSDVLSVCKRTSTNTFDLFYGGAWSFSINLLSSDIIAKGDNYLMDDDNRCLYYSGQSVNWVSDTRLKFATWSDAIGRSILHVDMTDYLNSTGFNISNTTLNDFTLSIDYSVQNSEDNENHTISFNNSSEYFMEYGENGKLKKVYMNIPYTEFYGFSYDENSFPDYDDVVIQNAIVNLDLVPVGGNTSINITSYVDCLYYLQHVYDDIVPEVLPLPEYEDTFVQNANELIQSINDLYVDSSYYSSGSFTFEQAKVLPDWADVCEIDFEYGLDGSDSVFEGEFFYYPIDTGGVVHVQDQIVDLSSYMFQDYIGYGTYYDIIRLRIFRNVMTVPTVGDVSIRYVDTVYIYLYSDRYIARKDAFTNMDILKMLQKSATNDVTFFESIRERIDDFEEKTLVAITGDENSIFAYVNSLDSDLNSGIQRIIDNMPVFNWSPFNDDDILNALYTIVSNQDNPKDGYARYIAWVKSESNSDNGFKLWANDMFDVFHDIYNFFNYQDDIDPNTPGLQKYIVYVQQYIKYLTQDTNDIDSSQYVYYKGIFDNTYNIHNVDGRSG